MPFLENEEWNSTSYVLNNFSFLVGSQIRFLVTNLNKKNFKPTAAELTHLVNLYGHDAYLYLLRCLVDQVDFRDQKGQKDQLKIQLLREEISHLTKQPNFASVICQALEGVDTIHEEYISHFSRVLKLPLAQEILLALGVSQSADPNIQQEGVKFLKNKLPDLTQNNIKSLPENVLHNLLYFLKTHEAFAKQKSSVIKALQKLQPTNSLVLTPLTDDGSAVNSKRTFSQDANPYVSALVSRTASACHPYQLMEDLGYSCCASVATFKELLSQFPKLKESDVALILGMMAKTHTSETVDESSLPLYTGFNSSTGNALPPQSTDDSKSGSTSWNVNVFVDAFRDLYPKLNWPIVIKHLDHPGFVLADQKGLALIMAIYRKASKEPFPLEVIFDEIWSNTTGQLSFLKLALAAPPDVFNFAAAPRRQPPVEGLHTTGGKTSVISPWYSLGLIETLLKLAETEHHSTLRSIFDHPIKHCPELLLLGLAQVKPTWNNILRSELTSMLMAMFLSANHPNSSLVLHRLWHINPSMVIRGMVEVYFKDQSTLSRLLDVAQDLKALTTVLESRPFSYGIDLASLASHREYLYLEKWLQDRINEHGLSFASACVAYLKDKLRPRSPLESAPKSLHPLHFPLSPEILATFFKFLHTNLSVLTPELIDELKQLNPKFPNLEPEPSQPGGTVQASAPASSVSNVVPSSTLGAIVSSQGAPPSSNQPVPAVASVAGAGAAAVSGVGVTPGAERVFPADIEDEANSYFQKIYTGQLSIEEVVNLLKAFKSSKNSRELDIFACMIHNLFDEYRFFPKYPDKELRITGILFGSLIQHQLVSFLPLGVALRYVLDALRKAAGTKMFKFGMYALEQFRPRLSEWPQYCSHILQIGHIKQHHPEIIEFIEKALGQQAPTFQQPELSVNLQPTPQPPATTKLSGPPPGLPPLPQDLPPSLPQPTTIQPPPGLGPVPDRVPTLTASQSNATSSQPDRLAPLKVPTPPPPQQFPTSTAVAVNEPIPTQPVADESFNQHPSALLMKSQKEIVQPDEATKDKMHFIFNNVSQQNLDVKANELKELLKPEHFDYLAQYLVVKRISIEQNFHQLYLAFLDKLSLERLNKQILIYTHENIKTLFKSEKLRTDLSEKSVLKHLGSWLGLITLAKNKPLFHKDVALKELLYQAFDQGTLVAIVPFVAKVLETCSQSKVFKPPNPWVVGIMRLLAEIYQLPELKLNLKFEIELLCNNLQLDLNELKPTTTLRDRRAAKQAAGTLSPDLSPPESPVDDDKQDNESPTGEDTRPVALPVAIDMSNLAQFIQYNPSITLFQQQPLLKRVVPVAIERAIREIIAPVVERSVTIAVITTKELVCKDFATEPDEQKLRRAAHLMVQNLAASLALVTCKEPLRVSMANHLRALFQITNEHLLALAEHAISVLCADNLDLACTVIEKAATERAIRETDDALAAAILPRRKHRERPTSQPFFDMSYLAGRYSAAIPDVLRPKPGGLVSHQLRVYEDFLTIPHQAIPLKAIPTSPYPQSGVVAAAPPSPAPAEPSPIPDGVDRAAFALGAIQIVPNVTHNKPMQYVIQSGTANQPGQERRPSASGSTLSLSQELQLQQAAVGKIVQETITAQEALERFNVLIGDLDRAVIHNSGATLINLPPEHEIHQHLGKIAVLVTQTVSRTETSVAFAQKVFSRLYEGDRKLHREVLLAILESLRDVSKKVVPELTTWLIYSEEERKFHREITVSLIRARLLGIAEFDEHLSKLIDGGRNVAAFEFALFLLRHCLVEARLATPSEFLNTLDALGKIARANPPDGLVKLLEDVKTLPAISAAAGKDDKSRSKKIGRQASKEESNKTAPKEAADPAGMREQVASVFQEWMVICLQPNPNDKALASYVGQLQQQGWLKTEELSQRFFRICTEISMENCFSTPGDKPSIQEGGNLSYQAVDAFAKLVLLLVKCIDPSNTSSKLALLTRVLGVVVKAVAKDYEAKGSKFNQRPYFRLFDNWLIDFNAPDPTILDPISLQILFSFSNAFSMLQPSRLPGFSFAWLELISHRMFMPKLLLSKGQKGWPLFQRLLVELFKFLEPYLRNAELNEPVRLLYKGALRVLLVLLHDFPEFLCDYHFSFCDVIPPSCIQMRNLILSAFPRSMRLPDPFTPNLKVDLLPEINQPPRILSNYIASLSANNFKVEVDMYLKTRAPLSFLLELRPKYLLLQSSDSYALGTRYNVPVINSLVLYVGTQAIAQLQNKSSQVTPPITHSAPMDIFQHLALDLDTEGRYLFLNAIANQLRYPNNHTHYFSCVLLYLFAEANQEIIQEQITRVLLERLIVNRPHPWGLLITFIELIKNPRYNFWSHSFTRCAPEIERLFESVARSCMGREPAKDISGIQPQAIAQK